MTPSQPEQSTLVDDGGHATGGGYWYRGVVQYGGGPEAGGYIVATSRTAVARFVWEGNEQMRDDPDADAHWIERRPMHCWERVPDEETQ